MKVVMRVSYMVDRITYNGEEIELVDLRDNLYALAGYCDRQKKDIVSSNLSISDKRTLIDKYDLIIALTDKLADKTMEIG